MVFVIWAHAMHFYYMFPKFETEEMEVVGTRLVHIMQLLIGFSRAI